ncbi:NADPH-dependent FMN reductase [Paramicrobacterium chengjingii]|uniref:NAD(P)H-dependent oxidoreductase n=1 Tax=Paramicrobacterium chengjingii TaxID=2769067 RepID=A0ABX6YEW4_9MICO|nr:NAD(P)H-dependent oxidoreductase [Microbacterium chengjingii]QPZ37329.1 NAD(P)H-dependent oxidoreductase [Microbacterium chengjingii]
MSINSPRPSERPLRIMLVLGSVRPGRIALPIALWVHDHLGDVPNIDIDFVDLMDEQLPFMDEPILGGENGYANAHSRAWSERVTSTDAVIFVAPAYGDGFSPVVRNALDYLNREWEGKRVGLVTYGRDAKRLSRRLSDSLQAKGMRVTRPVVAITDTHARVRGFDFDGESQIRKTCARMIGDLRQSFERVEPELVTEGVA